MRHIYLIALMHASERHMRSTEIVPVHMAHLLIEFTSLLRAEHDHTSRYGRSAASGHITYVTFEVRVRHI